MNGGQANSRPRVRKVLQPQLSAHAGVDVFAHAWVNLRVPLFAAENALVADTGLDVVGFM